MEKVFDIKYQSHGEKVIAFAIAEAHTKGKTVVRITGNYEISSVIVIPSHTTLILEDCRLRLADGVFTQMFTNEHAKSKTGRDCDIHIKGIGVAEWDGGLYNGLSERSANKNGYPAIWNNNFMVLSHVDRFSVEGVQCLKSRWYSMAFIDCTFGTIRDIFFDGDCRRIDEQTGKEVYGLIREKYEETIVKNGDGIDICSGCHDILVENITGFTEDDTVAIASLWRLGPDGKLGPTPMMREYGLSEKEGTCDVYNIIARNIRVSCFCSPVRILNQGGPRLYNILIDGVYDASFNDPHVNHGDCGVMIGDFEPYGDRQPSSEETFNIIVRNVVSRADTALRVYGGISHFVYENIQGFDRCPKVVDVSGADLV